MSIELSIIRTVIELRETVGLWRSLGESVALVPTMGALHAGHLALVDVARRHGTRVIVSIFVNPTQFAAHEDLSRYPQTFDRDCKMLAAERVDAVYAPTAAEMYPDGFATAIEPSGPAAAGLEDAFRPHFFRGVATVVAKLFSQSGADVAIFGEKDYQQLLVVRRMAKDLDLPVRILSAPTVREDDGLAMSSRNRFLSPEQRRTAGTLPAVLGEIATGSDTKSRQASAALDKGRKRLSDAGFKVDYLELRDAETLAPPSAASSRLRLLAAVHLGSTRLIDNVEINRS